MTLSDTNPFKRFDFSKGGATGETPIDAPESVRRNWIWLALLGGALVIGGLFAIAAPIAAGVAASVAIGLVFLVCGALQAVGAVRKAGWRGRLWHGASAAIALVGGALLVFQPVAGTVALSLLIIAVLIADGGARVVLGLQVRPERGWGWLTASGALSAVFGLGLALFALPVASLTLLGVFVGVSFAMEGAAFIYVAFAARPVSDRTVTPDVES
jgi:uncharacterized membrane protein HdeD (DUF308 family)